MAVEKGCLKTRDCDRYSKGQIGDCISYLNAGYTGYCKGLCCDGGKYNDGDLFATPEPKSKAAACFLSVMALLFDVLVTDGSELLMLGLPLWEFCRLSAFRANHTMNLTATR